MSQEPKPIIVFYHTTSPVLLHPMPAGTYEAICRQFVEHCNKDFDLTVAHLTVDAAEQYGNGNYIYDGDPKDIVYNRERCFYWFLQEHMLDKSTEFLFCEPDMHINHMWPALHPHADLSLLYRHDHTPHFACAWRLAKTTALPFFKKTAELIEHQRRDWHGDSEVMNIIYEEMFPYPDKPKGYTIYRNMDLNLNIELRAYEDYIKWRYTYMHHYTAERKLDLLKEKGNT